MRLIVVRHAAAEQRDARRWPDDSKRLLTEKGRAKFAALAEVLGRMEPDMQRVLSSRWVRAWQTAEVLTERARWPQPVAEATLELAPVEEIIEALGRVNGASPVAVVGHEPTLSELVSALLTGRESAMSVDLKKGAAVCIDFDDAVAAGAGSLKWMLTPRLVRQQG